MSLGYCRPSAEVEVVQLTPEKIDIEALLQRVDDHATGGVVLFLGKVRNHAGGREVTRMDYEAYPEMAEAKMLEVEKQTLGKWPVQKIALVHRTGKLQLGEVSVAIAVACAHREDAFEACRFAIDTLKEIVPVWKKEYFADGEAWVEGVIPRTP